jgi:predicted acetyltransferase
MRAAVARAVSFGDVVSALFPATTPIYRSLGFEHAGARYQVSLPAEALRAVVPSQQVKLRRMGPGDAAEVVSVLHRVHAATRASGPMSWGEDIWRLWLADKDDFLYLADDGFLVYRWDGPDMEVDNLVAGSADTARALWSIVGSSSSVAKRITATVAPDDPVLWLLRERTKDQITRDPWMFRVLDLPAAVRRRGYPEVVTATAVVQVNDPLLEGNTGRWRLEFAEGAGSATALEGDAAGPVLTVNAFSALYAGIPTATLRGGGLMSGDERYDEVLDAAFAARPYMLDHF